ncbi:MAG TPA: alpha/beta hydrolase [Flavihumibacter sp.]
MILQFRQKTIHYQLYGTGPDWVLALHGYGESGESFRALAEILGDRYRFICPDLPLHGETTWSEDCMLPSDLADMTQLFLTKYSISQITLAGYSMGGRLAITLVTEIPERIKSIWLMAPDGWVINPWYRFATQTGMGNRIFKIVMERPKILLKGFDLARRIRLVDRSRYKFAGYFLNDPTERQALYDRWTCYRKCHPDKKQLVRILQEHQISIVQFFGELDRIIRPEGARWIQSALPQLVQTHILKTGHRLLDPAIAPNIARILINAR